MAGKCVGENVTLQEPKHFKIMDRGSLWKVNENVTSIFKITGCYYRTATQKHIVTIDCKGTISNLMANVTVLQRATVLNHQERRCSIPT